ncbi:hypothetical protein PPL_09693 [Heterostelium album PN500]|uniref:Phospholipid/glycerol acyltransferase domain-containing protein n=1 Tax=Heterostelium pallidum (strain ATCC 26659 / Pp 5 / PN500) TaxID=670386 RepID=D3BNJ0_HETP5|nr:hypothetical protein PPL_09693 [Heterostelium album PN500]EFA76941.1 hypothetical protein PPL_09693 [Heterostelium album PN500]|eukprot:XP_020429073.1 hypothetical protein PPL_09693 [Heterostelium album PN500]
MEKFSDWRDGPTGIAPLLPPRNKQSESSFVASLVGNIFYFLLAPILCIIRIPFIIVFTLLLVLFDYIFKTTPLGVVGRVLNRTFAIVFGRSILFLFGFTFIDEAVESLSRSKQPQGSFKSVMLDDIIISNHTSYIDIIYLVYRFSPMFAVPPSDRDGVVEGRLIPLSLAGALKNAMFSPVQLYSDSIATEQLLARINNSWVGPLVVFAEGTTSNGLGLLEPAQVYLSRNCVPTLPLDGSSNQSVDTQDVVEWFDALFKALSSLTNCRRTKITAHKKLSFVAYWRGYKVKYDKSTEKKHK